MIILFKQLPVKVGIKEIPDGDYVFNAKNSAESLIHVYKGSANIAILRDSIKISITIGTIKP